jgi:hypothetical protein
MEPSESDLISHNSLPWSLTNVEAASNRQQIIVDLSNRVDAVQSRGGEHFLAEDVERLGDAGLSAEPRYPLI